MSTNMVIEYGKMGHDKRLEVQFEILSRLSRLIRLSY